MDFSLKELNKKIKNQYKTNRTNYVEASVNLINEYLKDVKINEAFFNEYHKLKSHIENRTTILPSAIIGIIAGIVATIAVEASFKIGFIAYAVVVFLGMAICISIPIVMQTKKSSIINPYILNKMEEKINGFFVK